MNTIEDFSPAELQVVRDTLRERYKADQDVQQADSELRLDPDSTTLSLCPTLYWEHDDCHFVICKTGKQRFFCQFFYGRNEQYGTGQDSYDDILDCLTTLLRVQADHELSKNLKKKG